MPALTTIALGGGALLGAGGAIAGGLIQKSATEDATNKQVEAQREAIAAQERQAARAEQFLREQAAQARADLAPFRQSQLTALGQLEGLADPNSELAQMQRSEATKAIQRTLAAQGLLRSGRQTQQLTGLELGLADQRARILQGLAGTGAGEAFAGVSSNLGSGLAGISTQLGQQLGSSFQNIGQITGQGILGGANAITGAFAGANNAIQGLGGALINMNLQNKIIESLKNPSLGPLVVPQVPGNFGVNFGQSLSFR